MRLTFAELKRSAMPAVTWSRAFISTLAEEAAKDRAALVCKLNGYNQLAEVKS